MKASTLIIFLAVALLSLHLFGANTNKVDKAAKVEKERKTEHCDNKLIIKARDKGSKKDSDYKIEREFPLMFKNNKKAKKVK
jgi:hypothetical protein